MAGGLTALLVTEELASPTDVLGTVGRALQGGLSAVLVRRPHGTAREVFDMTRQLRPATRSAGCKLLVSDRMDVALAADADGVHLGERSLPIAAVRRHVPEKMLLGRSTHDLDEATREEAAGADYLFLGPIFATETHPDATPLGLDHLREAVLRCRIPIVAIGGIGGENAPGIVATGAAGVAAIRAFSNAPDPAETARTLRATFAR